MTLPIEKGGGSRKSSSSIARAHWSVSGLSRPSVSPRTMRLTISEMIS